MKKFYKIISLFLILVTSLVLITEELGDDSHSPEVKYTHTINSTGLSSTSEFSENALGFTESNQTQNNNFTGLNTEITGVETDLWITEPNYILGNFSGPIWFLRGINKTEPDYKYKKYTRAVGDLIQDDDPLIHEYYVNKYVNPYNNTVVMVITDTSPEMIQRFEDKIPVPEGVRVLYRYSPFSYVQLKEWMWIINDKEADIAFLGVSENGTMITGVYNYTPEKGRNIVQKIEADLPKGIITFLNATRHNAE